MQSDAQMEQLKSQLKLQELEADVLAKKELMMLEYELTKDLRSKEQALKNQGIKTAKKFESSGNDVLGGINLGGFEPR